MNIKINNQSSLPIYEQIVNQIKDEMIRGHLKDGEMLPSIRSLAKDAHISVITTKRAYEELEKEDLIYSVAGKGFYVSRQNRNVLKEKKIQKLEQQMQLLIKDCKGAGLSCQDAVDMLELLWEEED